MRKLLWLQGRDRQVAYVGSHNLTAAGYNDQWECTNRLDSRDPGHVAALRDIHAVVSRLVPRTLEKIWTHTTPPVANDAVARVRFLSSLDEPLLDQLLEHIGDTHYLRVVTPFVDPWRSRPWSRRRRPKTSCWTCLQTVRISRWTTQWRA